MSEKRLSYDLDVAQAAVEHRDASNRAVAEYHKVEEDAYVVHRLGEIASKGPLQRLTLISERKDLESRAPVHHYEVDGKAQQMFTHRDPTLYANNVTRVDRLAAAHFEDNAGAYYDNAVTEANIDFINQGSPDRIITPDVLQQQADEARSLSQHHSTQTGQ